MFLSPSHSDLKIRLLSRFLIPWRSTLERREQLGGSREVRPSKPYHSKHNKKNLGHISIVPFDTGKSNDNECEVRMCIAISYRSRVLRLRNGQASDKFKYSLSIFFFDWRGLLVL